ncbi:hypothetical protein SEPCBS57363_000433 [Sporothrix epigloea]|uniref:WD repeat protein n=1 Tax=Sporothrix epigloea TaxID=1892477 RepID=A0ABP0D734_9PEZI
MAENAFLSIPVEPTLPSYDGIQLMSSPPRVPTKSFVDAGGKERRQPSITPRKFRRFFTPRPRVSANPSPAQRALRDLTARALNGTQIPASSPQFFNSSPLAAHDKYGCYDVPPSPRTVKRRKTGHHTPESSPIRPSSISIDAVTPKPIHKTATSSMPLSPLASSPLPAIFVEPESGNTEDCIMSEDETEPEFSPLSLTYKRTVSLANRSFCGQLMQREYGALSGAGYRQFSRPIAANELVAVGDEEGRVRLLDTSLEGSKQGSSSFSDIYLSFAAHGNAVIDLAFSEDDYLLATASGDQTGKVIDMMTQTPLSILDHHTASLKQVRFQPGKGEGNVLATSGRDGSVKIWDLRCRGGPAQEFAVEERAQGLQYSLPKKISQGCVVNSIYDAHARLTRSTRQNRKTVLAAVAADVSARWEDSGRIGEVSVTAIQFLPAGREHLILSACEADASIKLWDIRNVHTARQKTSHPISATTPPESHTQWRPFGMSSISLSTDGSRLYGLCKDNTVYAYATSHLVLGSAPELSSKGNDYPRRRNGIIQHGLGPLYGFRHKNFHATSFYVKTDVRPAKNGCPELLAVGSSDGCAVLFPTDERYFMGSGKVHEAQTGTATPIFAPAPSQAKSQPRSAACDHDSGDILATTRCPGGVSRTKSTSNIQGRLMDTIPIVRNGTALIRGHENKEVGAVSWTNNGSLVSVGDDHIIRCWREDRGKASILRKGGEGEGRRWASGWADVEGWDDSEDEWFEDDS